MAHAKESKVCERPFATTSKVALNRLPQVSQGRFIVVDTPCKQSSHPPEARKGPQPHCTGFEAV